MAEDVKAPPEKKKGRPKKMIIASVAIIALIGAGAAGGVFVTGGLESGPIEDPNRPKLVERKAEAAPIGEEADGKMLPKEGTISVKSDRDPIDPKKFEITYFPIEQTFTANLADGGGFVQVGLSLSTYFDSKVIANIQRQLVPIRSAVLLTLSDQDAGVLSTNEGKQLLQRKLTKSINGVLREKEGFGGVENVYFSNLVIQ
jgi:flagellar protein FliL